MKIYQWDLLKWKLQYQKFKKGLNQSFFLFWEEQVLPLLFPTKLL